MLGLSCIEGEGRVAECENLFKDRVCFVMRRDEMRWVGDLNVEGVCDS